MGIEVKMKNMDLYILKHQFDNDIKSIREKINEGLKLRSEFLKHYPAEKIKDMPIERYVIGKDFSFCYWLEQKLDLLGRIKGGSTADKKFGLYYGKTKNDSKIRYRHIKKWGNDHKEAYDNIKNEILNLLTAGKRNDIEKIESNRLSPLFKGKILSIYYPEKYLNIFSIDHIEHFIETIGISYDYNIINTAEKKKKLLLDFKNNDPYLKGLTNYEYSYFLYTGLTPPAKRKNKLLPDSFNISFEPIGNVKPEIINLTVDKYNSDKTGQRGNNFKNYQSSGFEERIKRIGNRGELIIFNFEKEALKKEDRFDLSELVKDVSRENKGYDILSYNPDGTERFIEVKSTISSPPEISFYITGNELKKAIEMPDYYIYIVFKVNTKKPEIFIFNPFKQGEEYYQLTPLLYKVAINSR